MKRSSTIQALVIAFAMAAGWPRPITAAQSAGGAQSAGPAQDADAATMRDPVPIAGFENGFFIQSPTGDTRLLMGLIVQTDGRFALAGSSPVANTFTIRRLRPTFSGRIGRYVEFRAMPDFGGGTTVLQDAYVDIRVSRAFRIRTGKDKTPVGYELATTDAYLLFPERTLASSLVPNRDVGVQMEGDPGSWLFYAVGLFNGVPDGTSSSIDLDTNGSKDAAGRVVVRPFARTSAAGPLAGLGFHVGASTGRQSGPLPSFKTSIGQTYFAYASAAQADGPRRRISPALFYYYKAFGGFAEYMYSGQAVAKGVARADVGNQAWEITTSYLLTGETASERIVRPRFAFEPGNGDWGALQLLSRYSQLVVDGSAFTAGLAAPGASRTARSFAVAANWYPSAYIKYYAAFERTIFGASAAGAPQPEDVLLLRAQLAF